MSQKLDPQLFNLIYPIVSIAKYQGGFIIQRKDQKRGSYQRKAGKRGQVKYLSQRSLSRLALMAQSISPGLLTSMLTLTYGLNYPVSGRKVKYHLRQVLQFLLRKYGHFSYIWFLEFQKRGAPHLHILTTHRVTETKRKMVAEYWVDIQGLGDWPYSRLRDRKLFHVKQSALRVARHPSTWQMLRSPEGATRYITAYASKPKQKEVPKQFRDVGRFWGNSPDLSLGVPEAIIDTDEEELRDWLCRIGHPVSDWDILPKVVLRFDKF